MSTFRVAFDDDGQPLNRAWNRAMRNERTVDEFIGLLKGVVADNRVNTSEVEFLARWVLANEEACALWPVNVIVGRLNRIFEDERIDEEECAELEVLIADLVGQSDKAPLENYSTRLPLCRPAPDVIFDQNTFVLTGRFVYGTRRICEREILQRGGRCSDNVTLQTSYLVIGEIGSVDWRHSTHGRKIETAVQYRNRSSLAIISEQHWASFLMPAK